MTALSDPGIIPANASNARALPPEGEVGEVFGELPHVPPVRIVQPSREFKRGGEETWGSPDLFGDVSRSAGLSRALASPRDSCPRAGGRERVILLVRLRQGVVWFWSGLSFDSRHRAIVALSVLHVAWSSFV